MSYRKEQHQSSLHIYELQYIQELKPSLTVIIHLMTGVRVSHNEGLYQFCLD